MARHKVLYFPFLLLHLYYALNLDHQCQSIYVSRALSMVVKIKILQGMVGGSFRLDQESYDSKNHQHR